MNICGCLVHIALDRLDAAAAQIADTPGSEIHAQSADGRLVVVVEDVPGRLASETIMDLHQVPGVVSLTLTYHHFEDLSETSKHTNFQTGGLPYDHF